MDKITPQAHVSPNTTAGLGLSKRELDKKDVVQKDLTLVLDWMVANKVLLILAISVLALSGIGYVIYNQVRHDTNMRIQDQYFAIEKDYLKIKNDFDEADKQTAEEAAKALDKTKKVAKKEANAEVTKTPPKAKATGDLDKDYGTVVVRFTELHSANPKSSPGKVTGLVLADIFWDYKKYEQAAQILEKSSEPNPKSLIDHMVLKKLSSTYLSMNKFDEVIKKNQTSLSSNKYPFMSSYFKLQTALAYDGLKQWDQAEQIYKDVIARGEQTQNLTGDEVKVKNRFGADQSAGEQAQKYLLLMRLKKSETQAGNE